MQNKRGSFQPKGMLQFLDSYNQPVYEGIFRTKTPAPSLATTLTPALNFEASATSEEIFTGYLSDVSESRNADNDGIQHNIAKAEWAEKQGKVLTSALHDIEKIFALRHTEFESGHNGLQFYHAQAIHAHLEMMVKGRGSMDASGCTSKALGFSPKWGAHLVCRWTLWQEL
ncbi:hypothetical protein IW261DRAFT_1424229 [Armillaria novae-zelandiae]|uniref:Uncharacterized protein n=1 Tax=Armillaria novae-zelandiae TaxID=153914 RepID=A0AA39NVJ8_9AGAR|nr:hypothetical protein IW261DRAFT_1424229 [Armillaria novae-zelandiae]